jgi:tetratricopeptide (TPR) repeat protein
VVLPGLTRFEPSVREQLQTRHESLERTRAERAVASLDLANEFGELGRLFLAAELPAAAETCFVNAETLAPAEMRWPYYLGHAYRTTGNLTQAGAAFARALHLRPDHAPSLVWSGHVALDLGRPDMAEPYFVRALDVDPGMFAARFGLGRAALARRDYSRAVQELETALALAPQASAAHYPLALAYRGLGDQARTDAHMQRRGDVEVTPPDPLMDDLDLLLESPLAYQRRGMDALERQAWTEAATHFRRGLELEPALSALRDSLGNKLGTALFHMGDSAGARRQFEQGVRDSPRYVANQVSLGVLLAVEGRDDDAVTWLRSAVGADPSHVEARLQLADALRRTRRLGEALGHYDEVLRLDPRTADAWFGSAMALVRLGRYHDAMARLEEAQQRHPGERRFAHAIARLLAAVPDASIRDGRRALSITEELRASTLSVDVGETMAMALAEVGRFAEAAGWQRQVIAGVRAGDNNPRRIRALEATLAGYERGEPSRAPWSPDDEAHAPRPAFR